LCNPSYLKRWLYLLSYFIYKHLISNGMLYIVLAVLVVLALSGIRVAQEYQRAVVFRLGRFTGTRGPGIYYLIPLIERQITIDIRTRTVDMEQQETITKDSVTIKLNAVLWFSVVDPEKAVIKVANYSQAVYQFSVTALRNIIGQHQLDEVLRERESINSTLQKIVDAATEPWGIKIEMVDERCRDTRIYAACHGPGSRSHPRKACAYH
jgi:regulator of protease activity HflC (stomatin/prohibitin superfamily)